MKFRKFFDMDSGYELGDEGDGDDGAGAGADLGAGAGAGLPVQIQLASVRAYPMRGRTSAAV
jgi:hypothetical protein